MLRRIAVAALGVGLTLALLITVLGLAPNAALFVSAAVQPTISISDTEPLPLTFFLARPSPEFAATLVSLNLSDQQANGWAMVLKDEGQLLGEAQARGTLAKDVGPIGAASWQRLKDEILSPDQYATLRQWAIANRDLAMPALRAALEGAASPVAPVSATGVAAAATSVANGSKAGATPAAGGGAGAITAAAAAATAVQAVTPAAAIAAAATAQVAATTVSPTSPTTGTAAPFATPSAALATTGATATAATPAAAGSATPTAAAAKPAGGASTVGSITVIGNGRAVATPDVARVTLGVNVTGDTVKAATAEANKNLASVVAKLKSMGVSDRDIQTTQYNVYPTTDERPTPLPAGAAAATPKPPKTVYHVQAAVTATLRDLSSVGSIIDAALEAGANTVGGISFTIDNPAPVTDQARANAVADAKAQATQLAQLNGVTLGPPRQITEVIGSPAPMPMPKAAAAPAAGALAAPPSIEGGELTYTSQIQITYEFTQ